MKTIFGLSALAATGLAVAGLWFLGKSTGDMFEENWDDWLNLTGHIPL